jgi:hypothetical protein
MPLNMELSFAHSNVAAVEGAWPVMGFTSHQQMHGEPSGRNVECSHFSRQHYGDRRGPHATRPPSHTSEIALRSGRQREHMVWQGFTRKCWSEFLCLGDYLAPPRQVRGFAPRDALGQHPPASPRRWRPAGGPVAGARSAKVIANQL